MIVNLEHPLIGKTFNNLTVLRKSKNRHHTSRCIVLVCQCSCANKTIVEVRSDLLKTGRTKSCGCMYRKHGASRNNEEEGTDKLLYLIWQAIKNRCYNKNNEHYKNYGGRGIIVYNKWITDFLLFSKYVETLPNGPDKNVLNSRLKGKRLNLSIDRINNNGNYEPGNLKWSTRKEQANNRRSNRIVKYNKKKKMTLAQAVERYAIVSYSVVKQRMDRDGWSLDKALTTPPKNRKL